MKHIMLTGGAGFIGSHTAVSLIEAGYKVLIVDNFSNSSPEVIDRLEQITGMKIPWVLADVNDTVHMEELFDRWEIDSVIHLAGSKAVGESVENPLKYYHNNVSATIGLCMTMAKKDVKRLVFSSSASVYGEPVYLPLDEMHRTETVNPYGTTKLVIEGILKDLYGSDPNWSVSVLRYFNPIGAHKSGLIGEDPQGVPSNLMPYILKVAAGELPVVNVYGKDYPTADGTGVRDYIHVVDLARGHVAALNALGINGGYRVYNLGTGLGTSVLELIKAFEDVTGIAVPWRFADKRPGDAAASWASADKALRELGWRAELGVEEMCRDAWNWVSAR